MDRHDRGLTGLSEETGRHLVYFAAERTLLVWISTALGMMALGFVVDRFGLVLRRDVLSGAAGSALLVLGALMSLTAAVRYAKFAFAYHRGGERPGYGIMAGVAFAVVVAVFAAIMAAILLTVARSA